MNTSEPMTQGRLDEIEAALSYASHWPWSVETRGHLITHVNDADGIPIGMCHECTNDATYEAPDADLIAHAPEYITDLLAEVERLRARLTVDDDMVERAARAYFEYQKPGELAAHPMSWERLTTTCPSIADTYRDRLCAVMDAALGTGEQS